METIHPVEDKFYADYLTFQREGTEAAASLFEDESIRDQYLSLVKPMTRPELEAALGRMDESQRARYVRRVNMGFELATLTEESGGIIKHVRFALQKHGMDLPEECTDN